MDRLQCVNQDQEYRRRKHTRAAESWSLSYLCGTALEAAELHSRAQGEAGGSNLRATHTAHLGARGSLRSRRVNEWEGKPVKGPGVAAKITRDPPNQVRKCKR